MQDENNSSNDTTATARVNGRQRRRSRGRAGANGGPSAGAALVIEQAGLVSAAPAVEPSLAAEPSSIQAARAARLEVLERLAVDVRTLVTIARSAALPPARRLDEMERTVARHLDSLRADVAGSP
jgi:hypothetical protein